MGYWWKFLSVALLLFASIAALRTPLAPALVHATPDRLATGTTAITITGYNTSFTSDHQVYLINSKERLCAGRVEIIAPNMIKATFNIASAPKEALSSIVVHHPEKGRLGLPEALFHPSTGEGWGDTGCTSALAGTIGAGEFNFPNRSILYETIRNLNFHVPMWFTMMALMGLSLVHSLIGLNRNSLAHDRSAAVAVKVGLLFCALGLITGSIWARTTWGGWWTNDVKLNGAAVTALIYLAYLVLRGSVQDPGRRARLSAVYNIFAFIMLLLFLMILPRLNAIDSLHPGSGGNPAFDQYDLDDNLRMVFYPAVAGWIMLGLWIFQLGDRTERLREKLLDREFASDIRPMAQPAPIGSSHVDINTHGPR